MKPNLRVPSSIAAASTALLLATTAPNAQDRALRFDGVDDLFAVPHSERLDLTSYTFAAWIRVDTASPVWQAALPTDRFTIAARGEGPTGLSLPDDVSATPLLLSLFPDGKLSFAAENATGGGASQTIDPLDSMQGTPLIDLTDGTWHLVGVSFHANPQTALTTYFLFVDDRTFGPFGTSNGIPFQGTQEPLFLGVRRALDSRTLVPSFSRFFPGWIDDVSLWSRSLPAEEISDLRTSLPPCRCSGLVGSWRFNDASGQFGVDYYRGLDGTLGVDENPGADDPTIELSTKTPLSRTRSLGGGDTSLQHASTPQLTVADSPGGIVWEVSAPGAFAQGTVAVFHPTFDAPTCSAFGVAAETLWTGAGNGGLPPRLVSFDAADTARYAVDFAPGQLALSTCLTMSMQVLVQETATTPASESATGGGPDNVAFSDAISVTLTR